jgi:acylphosphatase
MNKTDNARLHAIIEGSVQGVGFRYFVLFQANGLGLTGWVRNIHHSGVEVVAEGIREELEQLLCKLQMGPDSARVDNVHIEWGEYSGKFPSFDVHPSA